MAEELGSKDDGARLLESSSGSCDLGAFGTAIFETSDAARVQVWWLSNGCDYVLATHISKFDPSPEEVAQADEIVKNIRIVDESAGSPNSARL
jgi:hypothetical protein